jgi:hypothetical protein
MPIIKLVYEYNWNHWSMYLSIQQSYYYTHQYKYDGFPEDNLYGIFHKAQNHLSRERGGRWTGWREVVVHTIAFPVRKIYGTKSPLSKRQLWGLLLYVGSCITVITTAVRVAGSTQRERQRGGVVCHWLPSRLDVSLQCFRIDRATYAASAAG